MLDERAAHTTPLLFSEHVSVSNEVDVAHVLDSHYADQLAVHFVAPELDAFRDLLIELVERHVRFVPAIGRNRLAICLSSLIYNREDPIALIAATKSNLRHLALRPDRCRRLGGALSPAL